MIPLLVTGAVLLLLVALLLAPVRLEVRFQEKFSATVKYLFFSFPLTGEKAEEPPPQETPMEKVEEPSAENGFGQKLKALLHQEGLRGFLGSLQELAHDVKSASQNLLKHVKLKRFDLYVCLGGKRMPPNPLFCMVRCAEWSTLLVGPCLVCFLAAKKQRRWTWTITQRTIGWIFLALRLLECCFY